MTKQSEQSLENNLIQQLVGLGYERRSKHFKQSVSRFMIYLMVKPVWFYEKNGFISCTKSIATYEHLGMSRYLYNLFCHFVHKLHSCIKYLNCVTDDKQLVANFKIQLQRLYQLELPDHELRQVLNFINKGNIFNRAKVLFLT